MDGNRKRWEKVKWSAQEQNPEPRAQVGYPKQEELSDKWKQNVRYNHHIMVLEAFHNYSEKVLTSQGNSVGVD